VSVVAQDLASEIILVDTGNTDSTNDIARSFGVRIVTTSNLDYSHFRNAGLKTATGEWILYVDADERVTPLLKKEIEQIMSSDEAGNVYQIPRRNIYLGREMHFGGWGQDKVIRLFRKGVLLRYEGALHEQPIFTGQLRTTNHELIHHSHRDLASMLNKTLEFTQYEAKLRLEANHPLVVWWRFLRVMFTEFWLRFVKLSAWKDGTEGIIDGIFQVFNSFVIYARLWEMQNEKNRHL